MTDAVLDVSTQFSKGLVVAVRLEDGVVAEALPSPTLLDNLAVDDAFELMDHLDAGTTTGTDVLFFY